MGAEGDRGCSSWTSAAGIGWTGVGCGRLASGRCLESAVCTVARSSLLLFTRLPRLVLVVRVLLQMGGLRLIRLGLPDCLLIL
jgi:hypothetical protein